MVQYSGIVFTDVVEQVKVLAQHPDFTLKTPIESDRSIWPCRPNAFHTRMVLAILSLRFNSPLDPINPQTAARFVPYLGRWRRIESKQASLMRGQREN